MPAGAACWPWSAGGGACSTICARSTPSGISTSSAGWEFASNQASSEKHFDSSALAAFASRGLRYVAGVRGCAGLNSFVGWFAGAQSEDRTLTVKVRVERQIGNSLFSLETGFFAKQASACVLARYADTVVLNAVATGPPRPGI